MNNQPADSLEEQSRDKSRLSCPVNFDDPNSEAALQMAKMLLQQEKHTSVQFNITPQDLTNPLKEGVPNPYNYQHGAYARETETQNVDSTQYSCHQTDQKDSTESKVQDPPLCPVDPLLNLSAEQKNSAAIESGVVTGTGSGNTLVPFATTIRAISDSLSALAPTQIPYTAGMAVLPYSSPTDISVPYRQKGASAHLPSPYETAQALLENENIVISGNAIYIYDGKIYRILSKEDVLRIITGRCRETVRAAGNAGYVEQVFKCLFTEPAICHRNLQPLPEHLVFQDGVINLDTGEFLGHSPDIFATSLLNARFYVGQSTPCPTFDSLIQWIADGDAELEARLWEIVGYTLTQDQRGKCFVLFQGPSDSGKSILGNFIRTCVNPESVSSLDIQSFGSNFALADLVGKRLCIDLDLPAGGINAKAASMIKKLTGGDLLSTDVKYMPRISFLNTAKLLFASNHAVATDMSDKAFLRRLIVVPFKRSVPREEQDVHLLDKILTERDGVVIKSLHYYRALKNQNYRFSGNFQPNEALGAETDPLTLITKFLRNFCVECAGAWIPTQLLWERFMLIFKCTLSLIEFSKHLSSVLPSVFPTAKKDRGRISGEHNPISGFKGIYLRDS